MQDEQTYVRCDTLLASHQLVQQLAPRAHRTLKRFPNMYQPFLHATRLHSMPRPLVLHRYKLMRQPCRTTLRTPCRTPDRAMPYSPASAASLLTCATSCPWLLTLPSAFLTTSARTSAANAALLQSGASRPSGAAAATPFANAATPASKPDPSPAGVLTDAYDRDAMRGHNRRPCTLYDTPTMASVREGMLSLRGEAAHSSARVPKPLQLHTAFRDKGRSSPACPPSALPAHLTRCGACTGTVLRCSVGRPEP